MALNKSELNKLMTLGGRTKYTDEKKDEALRYLIANADKGATLGSTAEKFGMSVQTLSSWRKVQLIEAGLVDAPEDE